MSGPTTVLVFGTFDGLHEGHRYFLRRARSLGDRLVVSLSRDEFVRAFKAKSPRHDETQRRLRLEASGLADAVHLSDPVPGSYDILAKTRPDIVCLGYDQDALEGNLRRWLQAGRWGGRLVRVERKPGGIQKGSNGLDPTSRSWGDRGKGEGSGCRRSSFHCQVGEAVEQLRKTLG
jgi:cytidyltransferase-like protein